MEKPVKDNCVKPDWGTGDADSRWNTCSGYGCERFLGEISIWIHGWAKQIAQPNVSGHFPIHLGLQRPKTEERLNSLSAGLNKLAHLPPILSAPSFQSFRLALESIQSVLRLSGLPTTPPSFLGLLFADYRSGDISGSIAFWSNIF